ncbi:MFS transporter [Mycolicibacterium litorale]|uniref:MFS transporter n=1 Tax=Mycolicibacterium litorale TaxID=758802 RepID=UPI003CEA903E
MRRVAGAAFVGSTIEFYDFFVYGTAAALVFGPVFFPALGTAAGTVAAFATFGVAFFFRPLGAVVFGHLGDRWGRKRTLIYTLSIMGAATIAIGLMPTTSMIGIAAPIGLVVLRALQGLAVGGEWAGAALLTAEYSPPRKRGFYGMFTQLGPGAAFSLSSATFLIAAVTMTQEQFLAWGWRIPFVASVLLLGVGLYIRLRVEETPEFVTSVERDLVVRFPFAEAMRTQWRRILLAGGTLTMMLGFFYVAAVFLTSFATQSVEEGGLGLPRTTVLAAGIWGGLVFVGATAVAAIASDTVGRLTVMLVGTLAAIPVGPAAFLIMTPGSGPSLVIALTLLMCVLGIPSGVAASHLPEIFPTEFRYTAAGLGYNLAGVLGGALPLLIAPPLVSTFGASALGWYLAVLGLVSTLCVLGIRRSLRIEATGPVSRTAAHMSAAVPAPPSAGK